MFEIRSILLSLSFAHIVELRLGMDFGQAFGSVIQTTPRIREKEEKDVRNVRRG